MSPRNPTVALPDLVEAASETFVVHGYARAQVADVAGRLGVAKGTIYGYVDGKESLFRLALAHGDDPGGATAASYPLSGDDLPDPLELLRGRLGGEFAETLLDTASRQPSPDAGAELAAIVDDLLDRLTRHRVAIKLVDRCATDFPGLAALWFEGGRWGLVELLAGWLRHQAEHDRISLPGDADVLARSVIELCALWAVHLPWDRAPRPSTPGAARATLPAMVRAMAVGGSGPLASHG